MYSIYSDEMGHWYVYKNDKPNGLELVIDGLTEEEVEQEFLHAPCPDLETPPREF